MPILTVSSLLCAYTVYGYGSKCCNIIIYSILFTFISSLTFTTLQIDVLFIMLRYVCFLEIIISVSLLYHTAPTFVFFLDVGSSDVSVRTAGKIKR
jgi:hypothetical protein